MISSFSLDERELEYYPRSFFESDSASDSSDELIKSDSDLLGFLSDSGSDYEFSPFVSPLLSGGSLPFLNSNLELYFSATQPIIIKL
jgi:hypothetical protein